jgi:hypothetical protein
MSGSKEKDVRLPQQQDEKSLMDEWLELSERKAAEKSALHKMMSELKKQLKN